jgi:hypothetical protein
MGLKVFAMAAYFARLSPGSKQTLLAFLVLLLLLLYPAHLFVGWSRQVRHHQEGVGLNALALAVTQYAQDHGGRLPPMRPLPAFQAAVLPYTRSREAFHQHEDPAVLFLPNLNLSGRRLFSFHAPAILLYESAPSSADGSRWVSFLPVPFGLPPLGDPDFTGLRLVNEREWQTLKTASHIP